MACAKVADIIGRGDLPTGIASVGSVLGSVSLEVVESVLHALVHVVIGHGV